MQKISEIYVVGLARTPIGAFQGSLSKFKAAELGAHAIRAAVSRSRMQASDVSEVVFGSVLTAGQGQAPARQAALGAGLGREVPCLTINKVCGSGMKALMLGAQSLALGDANVVVAGGMESMSHAPYLLPAARSGYRMGHQSTIDSMIFDGLWDPYNDQHMGNCGELCARELNFSRQDQDKYAIESFERAQTAQKKGFFKTEIEPIEIVDRKGQKVSISEDEGPLKAQVDKIPGLKPAFDKNGTITAANASSINDGAAALVLANAETVSKKGLKPLAKIVSWSTHAQAPEWFTTAPAPAMKKAMLGAGWSVGEVDLFEVNEAFAVVAMAAAKELSIPHDKLNVWGGAIALGHPIGASGARIVATLISSLKTLGKKKGVAGICIGGGEATAICVEVCT